MSTKLISTITNLTLVIITLVITAMFFFGGVVPETAGTVLEEPTATETFLIWTYILFGLSLALVVVFAILEVIKSPKSLVQSLVAIGVLGVVLLISYSFADATPLDIPGYTGPDNVPSRLIWTDVGLYSLYLLFGGAIIAMLVSEVAQFFKS